MPRLRFPALLLVAVLLVGTGAAALWAQDEGVDPRTLLGEPEGKPLAGTELEAQAVSITSVMRCVTCQGLSVTDSLAPAAIAMKGEVRELLAQGYSRDQIMGYFEGAYGEFIRLVPKPRGFNLVVWVAPLAALLLGVLLVTVRLRARRGATDGEEPGEEDADLAAYRERVRREVGS